MRSCSGGDVFCKMRKHERCGWTSAASGGRLLKIGKHASCRLTFEIGGGNLRREMTKHELRC